MEEISEKQKHVCSKKCSDSDCIFKFLWYWVNHAFDSLEFSTLYTAKQQSARRNRSRRRPLVPQRMLLTLIKGVHLWWGFYRSAPAGLGQNTRRWAVTPSSWWSDSLPIGHWTGCRTHQIPAGKKDNGWRLFSRQGFTSWPKWYLEPGLLEEIAEFGGDVLESILLPVHLFLRKNVQKKNLQTCDSAS